MASRERIRPWTIENVFLFDAQWLANELTRTSVKMGVATSVRRHLWEKAEIYPADQNILIRLSPAQRDVLALFHFEKGG